MQGTQSKTTSGASLLAPVTDTEFAKTDTSFLALEVLDIYLHSGPFCRNSSRYPRLSLVCCFCSGSFINFHPQR